MAENPTAVRVLRHAARPGVSLHRHKHLPVPQIQLQSGAVGSGGGPGSCLDAALGADSKIPHGKPVQLVEEICVSSIHKGCGKCLVRGGLRNETPQQLGLLPLGPKFSGGGIKAQAGSGQEAAADGAAIMKLPRVFFKSTDPPRPRSPRQMNQEGSSRMSKTQQERLSRARGKLRHGRRSQGWGCSCVALGWV